MYTEKEELLKDFREGRVALSFFKGTESLLDLRSLIDKAFPEYLGQPNGIDRALCYYYSDENDHLVKNRVDPKLPAGVFTLDFYDKLKLQDEKSNLNVASVSTDIAQQTDESNGGRKFSTGSQRDNDSGKPLVNHFTPYARLRFGQRLRDGANKYGKKNWSLGQPTDVQIESIGRHLAKWELNDEKGIEQDEDHLSAILFNVMMIMQNEDRELNIPWNHYAGKLS